jgi:FMN phosphatase YigB (HAD superfamily)
LFSKEENLHFTFSAVPHAIDTIKTLREAGIKLALCTNSSIPLRTVKILEKCGFNMDWFDSIVISGELGIRKPNPEILN